VVQSRVGPSWARTYGQGVSVQRPERVVATESLGRGNPTGPIVLVVSSSRQPSRSEPVLAGALGVRRSGPIDNCPCSVAGRLPAGMHMDRIVLACYQQGCLAALVVSPNTGS
jgi:hypothetical protein